MRTAIAILAVVVLAPVAAHAFDDLSWSDVSRNRGGANDAYVTGVLSAAEYANHRQVELGKAPIYCPPPGGVSVRMALDASSSWVERNASFRSFPAMHVIYGALHDTYPCPTS